jgi:hypothetical protein
MNEENEQPNTEEQFGLKNVRRSYSLDDMMWAFEQGIHEGKLREVYKNAYNFSESELEYYLKFR